MWSWKSLRPARRRRLGLDLAVLKRMRLPELKHVRLPDLHPSEIDWGRGRMGSRAATLWPTLFAAAGAGVAFWWWNQWARGRAEAEASAARDAAPSGGPPSAVDKAGGREGEAHPELVMAHAPPPPGAPVEGEDIAHPELVMAHAPQGAAAPSGTAANVRAKTAS